MVGLFSIDLTLKQKVDKLEKNVKKKFFVRNEEESEEV